MSQMTGPAFEAELAYRQERMRSDYLKGSGALGRVWREKIHPWWLRHHTEGVAAHREAWEHVTGRTASGTADVVPEEGVAARHAA